MNYTPLTGIDSDEYALFMWDNLVGFGILNIPDTSDTKRLLRIAQNFNMNQLRTSLTKIYQGYPFNSPLPPNPVLANAIINEYFTPQELANPATITTQQDHVGPLVQLPGEMFTNKRFFLILFYTGLVSNVERFFSKLLLWTR